MTVLIRPATRADAPEILAMVKELAAFEREPDAVVATVEDLERDGWGDGAGRGPVFEALMAVSLEGTPLGFALFFHNYSTWRGRPGLYVEDLYVRPEGRGRGVGALLLQAVARIAVDRQCRRIDLWVLGWNPAREFYHRLGFVDMTEWRPYRLETAQIVALADRDLSDKQQE